MGNYNSKAVWEKHLKLIKKPINKKFIPSSTPSRLAACIVEPRNHPYFAPVLWQLANIYGNNEIALYIFHGTKNESFVKEACEGWSDVTFKNLEKENLTWLEYNNLLKTLEFWKHMESSKNILIFQTDTLLFKKIDPKFYKYAYIGAPWTWKAIKQAPMEYQVGNGGFSMRTLEFMLECCNGHNNEKNEDKAEDVFFSKIAFSKGLLPSRNIAKTFSVEYDFYANPIGVHKIYTILPTKQVLDILKNGLKL